MIYSTHPVKDFLSDGMRASHIQHSSTLAVVTAGPFLSQVNPGIKP